MLKNTIPACLIIPAIMNGQEIVDRGNTRRGEAYDLGVLVPKNNVNWHGPWDCAEFATWLVYQVSQKLYGCEDDFADPAKADSYTGWWKKDAETTGRIISVEQAAQTPGAAVLRIAAAGNLGHIVLSDGKGGTIEAHSKADGVINSVLHGRRWDYGILIPWITYNPIAPVNLIAPNHTVYRLTNPVMVSPVIGKIQQALIDAGFGNIETDNIYGIQTANAIKKFQSDNGLVADGETGKIAAEALHIEI